MHLAIHVCALVFVSFSINVELSVQKKRQRTSVRTWMELYERKFGTLEADVFGLNQEIATIWETVNKTRNMIEINASSEPGTTTEHNSKKLNTNSETKTYINELVNCSRELGDKLYRIGKGMRDAKLATNKRFNKLETDYQSELSTCMDMVSDIERKHRNLSESINELKQLPDRDAINEQLTKHSESTISVVSKVKENLALLSERHEATVLNQINEMNVLTNKYNELKTEFESYRKGTSKPQVSLSHLKQTDWKQFGNSVYKRLTVELTWMDAMQMCKFASAGDGYLARIYNGDEMKFVAEMMYEKHFWLGGCQLQKQGNWQWCGNDHVINSTHHVMNYTSWRQGEPNSASENCLQGYGYRDKYPGKWNDKNCYNKLAFVCEIPIQGETDLGIE